MQTVCLHVYTLYVYEKQKKHLLMVNQIVYTLKRNKIQGNKIMYWMSGKTMDARGVRQAVEILQISNTVFKTLSFMPFRFNSKKERSVLP